ncbi:MAG: TetR/AcrR family transcriptional regulator [Thermodesulfobacteriota bacterium]|nr:TetR/AcrR family transcriptional regulator [Thermodesulfobacteriota bacterium]
MGSLIEGIRKEQIIGTAITTIADKGFINAPLSEIAKEAGISKGVISYYFKSKDELVKKVMDKILSDSKKYIDKVVAGEKAASDKITAYINASFDYMEANKQHFDALVDLWGSITTHEERLNFNKRSYDPCRHFIEEIIRAGIKSGEFVSIDVHLAASLIQAVIDGVMIQWLFDENAINLKDARNEVVKLGKAYLLR